MALSNNAQSVEELKKRYEALNKKKITAEANLKTSNDNLEKLKKEALEKYGTDNLDALRAKLDEMTKENERKRAEYQQHLSDIETRLANVEAEHATVASKTAPQ